MPQTRSASKRAKSGQVQNGADEVLPRDDAVGLLPSEGSVQLAKKRREERADVPKKRRRGNPAELCQLNLDVLFILATYIRPLDLLNLARTCKSLRSLLMDRSSEFVWRAARRQFQRLPDCPDDLSEPAYANLAFYARCHGCGKYSSAIFWQIRRRYCPNCRVQRLCHYASWPDAIFRTVSITAEYISTLDKAFLSWHDKDQVASLMKEYERSSDKEQFLKEKNKQYRAIYDHAKQCEIWQRQMAEDRKDERDACRQERYENIIERLKLLGYEREISYIGPENLRESRKMPAKPLTDAEWAQMLPTWLETMNRYRRMRLESVVYSPRRQLLVSEYDEYVRYRPTDTPIFDLLPHVTDLACFPPFRDIIKAPEGTQMGEKPFASAFSKLPGLVEEWKKQLDAEAAELVKIPHSFSQGASSHPVVESSGVTSKGMLHLACALFKSETARLFPYPEVFLTSRLRYSDERVPRPTGSIRDRFGVEFLGDAPHIIHACGLDPSVATPDDMNRRNARLRCLVCKGMTTIVMKWTHAMSHASAYHRWYELAPPSEPPYWQLVSDEQIDKIQAVEESVEKSPPCILRCLLCQPRVGDAFSLAEAASHLRRFHAVGADDIKEGVHYVAIGISRSSKVEMVEEGGQVVFREFQRCPST